MARKLIIPDIHNEWKVIKIFLEKYGNDFDERYFLGDFFDDWDDTPTIAIETAIFVKWLLEDPRNKLCMGNHDMPYRYPYNNTCSCPGFNIEKSLEIGKILSMDDWSKIKLAYFVDGWLISHAGVHPSFFGFPRIPIEDITVDMVLEACDKAINRLDNNGFDILVMPGTDRGCYGQQYGGITWLDWNRLPPIPNIKQIVGHTPGLYAYTRYTTKEHGYVKQDASFNWNVNTQVRSQNWCLDTETRSYIGILDNGKLTVDLRNDYCPSNIE